MRLSPRQVSVLPCTKFADILYTKMEVRFTFSASKTFQRCRKVQFVIINAPYTYKLNVKKTKSPRLGICEGEEVIMGNE